MSDQEQALVDQIAAEEQTMDDLNHAWFGEVVDDVEVPEAVWEERKVQARDHLMRLLALDMALDELRAPGAIAGRVPDLHP